LVIFSRNQRHQGAIQDRFSRVLVKCLQRQRWTLPTNARLKMKQLIAATVLVGISNLAIAADAPQLRHRFTEYANVINVEPVFRQVRYEQPQKECWIEQQEQVVTREGSRQNFGQSTRRSNSAQSYSGADALIGGLIGGVIGNQLGKSSNRGARNGATVAGAIVGSVIANEARGSDVSRHRRHNQRAQARQPQRVISTRPVERCRETVHTAYEQRVQAYDVTYEYRGRTFTTRMKRDPGDQIELQVNLAPARH